MFGNWPTAHQNIVAENAHGVDEHVECGLAKTTDASSRSRVMSSVLLLPRVARTYMEIHASAIHAWIDERRKYLICAGKVLSKWRKGSGVSRGFAQAARQLL